MNDPNRDELEGSEQRDEPEIVPAISAEQPPIAAGIGVGAYVGRTEDLEQDNDQESHVSPSDNDGETVPSDQVVDEAGS